MISPAAYRVLINYEQTDTLNFTELCSKAGYPTDLGGYYIRQLTKGDYIVKVDHGSYAITPKGKQTIAIAYEKKLFVLRPRLNVLIVAKQGDNAILLKRKRQPFIDVIEWPAGAVNLGEPLADAANRIVKHRLGIDISPTLKGYFRRIDMLPDESLVFDDKLFAVYALDINQDQAIVSSDFADVILQSSTELASLENRTPSLLDIFDFAHSSTAYTENTYILPY